MLAHRLRCWPNIKITLGECSVFTGYNIPPDNYIQLPDMKAPALKLQIPGSNRCTQHLHFPSENQNFSMQGFSEIFDTDSISPTFVWIFLYNLSPESNFSTIFYQIIFHSYNSRLHLSPTLLTFNKCIPTLLLLKYIRKIIYTM